MPKVRKTQPKKRRKLRAILALAPLFALSFPVVSAPMAQALAANDSTAMTATGTPSSSWERESTYWRSNYASRPYYKSGRDFTFYEPAYRYGTSTFDRNPGRRYEDLNQDQLRADWAKNRGTSKMNWSEAKDATQDAYNRLHENSTPNFLNTMDTQRDSATGSSSSNGPSPSPLDLGTTSAKAPGSISASPSSGAGSKAH